MTNVYVAPEAGFQVAALCERAAAVLGARLPAVASLADGGAWLGDCEEGRGWTRLLYDRAMGPNSLHRLFEQHIANLTDMAERYRQSVAGYVAVDRAHGGLK